MRNLTRCALVIKMTADSLGFRSVCEEDLDYFAYVFFLVMYLYVVTIICKKCKKIINSKLLTQHLND